VNLDNERKKLQGQFEDKKSQQNKISKEIGKASNEERKKLLDGVGNLKKEIQEIEASLREVLVK
jgi:seryl-tRNA synthetase